MDGCNSRSAAHSGAGDALFAGAFARWIDPAKPALVFAIARTARSCSTRILRQDWFLPRFERCFSPSKAM
jgi:hypothetical protein